MPSDYYDDEMESDRMPAERKEDAKDEKTALIPESLCPGMGVGDEVTLRIVAVHDGELEVAYDKPEREDEEEPSMSEAMESNDSMASMMD